MSDAEKFPAHPRLPLWAWILLGLGLGLAAGIFLRQAVWRETGVWIIQNLVKPIGTIWLRLIFMTVVPLVFCALALGVAGMGELARLGRVGLKTLIFTVVISSLAVVIGIALVNLVRPGEGLPEKAVAELRATFREGEGHVAKARQAKGVAETLVDIVPRNPLEEAATAFDSPRGGMLAVMFFALMFGTALASVRSEKTQSVSEFLEGLYEVLMKIIGWAMRLAPVGVGALICSTTATLGLTYLEPLGWYVGVVLAGLALHLVVVYGALLLFVVKTGPWSFFLRIHEVMATAFATSSSNATLPTTLRVSQERLGLPREISHFVLTLGSTANQNGTALFEGVTILFLAQFFGIELTLSQQVTVVLMSVLAGIGTAGVPGGSLPMIVIVMESVGIPGEGIGIILGVDRILDMCRTTLNVTGDVVVAAAVSVSEGHPLGPAR